VVYRITSVDKGLEAFERALKQAFTITVGIHEAEGVAPKKTPEITAAYKEHHKESQRRFGEARREDERWEKMQAKLAAHTGTLKSRAKLEARIAKVKAYRDFSANRAIDHAAKRPMQADYTLDLIEVAENHEFGLTVPMRSFVRGAVDDHPELEAKYAESMRTALKPGGRGVEQQAQRFGLYVVGLMQQRIADGIDPELSEATLKYKKSLNVGANAKETPLILTGQLRSSIRAKVEKT
jgi:hypothetical protein